MTSPNETTSSPKRPPFNQRLSFWIGVLIFIFVIFFIYHYFHKTKNQKIKAGLPVVSAVAQTSDVPVYLSGLGTVTPTATVTVRTQINGQLQQVLFKEGQMVTAGEVLAQIDPRPYQAQLTQFEGQLARDKALLENANLDLKRYKLLWKQDSVSKQILDTQNSLVHQLEGTVQVDLGQVESTKLNLIYCRILSPVTGRVGLRLVDQGNYVQTSDPNGLAVINTLHPMTVVFSLPEDNIPELMTQVQAGKILKAQAYDRTQTKLLAEGTLLTVDNQIDPTTGTVKLKAQFENEKNILFPSQFVNIRLLVETLQNATVIPTAAIQHGSKGTFVYLIENNEKAVIKPVVTGVTVGNNTSIKSGITSGQSVVVEGADKLTDGAAVTVVTSNQALLKIQGTTT